MAGILEYFGSHKKSNAVALHFDNKPHEAYIHIYHLNTINPYTTILLNKLAWKRFLYMRFMPPYNNKHDNENDQST